jgi:DNA repair protein RAD16
VKAESGSSGSESVYEPEGQSTPAYPGDASDDSALSDLSDASDLSDSDTPQSSTKGKGKGKGKGFAGKGRRLADGEDVEPKKSRMRDAVDHIDYCKRYPDEDDEQYERRCFKKWTYDKGADDREEFKKKERKLKKQLGRKLTNGEKNEIRLVKVSTLSS